MSGKPEMPAADGIGVDGVVKSRGRPEDIHAAIRPNGVGDKKLVTRILS